MLSIIVYGRNDSHGYNYHKRLALSLNCIAELLSKPNDEIVFVDFYTLEDEPTALEAISDTLTSKAKNHLKIIRLRSSLSHSKKEFLLSKEAFLRNTALQRTHIANQWILSTNIDMIFVPHLQSETFSSILSDLPQGFYQLPRFELPENLWESELNRFHPRENLSFLRKRAKSLHLNTAAKRPGFLLYDNPGDFQLVPREAIFEIGGFDEQMIHASHVDSNLCKRLSLYFGQKAETLEEKLWAYHCNHTRQSSSSYAQLHPENDWNLFVRDVNSPYLSNQKGSWGLQGVSLEKIDLQNPKKGSDALSATLQHASKKASAFMIDQDSFNTLTYTSTRIFPYLADHFYHLPAGALIAYIGHNPSMLSLIENYLKNRQLDATVLSLSNANSLHDLYSKEPAIMIFEFGFDSEDLKEPAVTPRHLLYAKLRQQLREIMKAFLQIVRLEKKQQKNVKFIGINALYTDFRTLLQKHLLIRKNTFLTGICYGYVAKKKQRQSTSRKTIKKRTKFFLAYLCIRFFYRYTDKLRYFSYRNKALKKFLQYKES